MKAIILAAGCGTRLRPYTNQTPKCMVKLADKHCIIRLTHLVMQDLMTL